MARRRIAEARDDDAPAACSRRAEHALGAATQATQDSLKVAIEGYSAAPKGETILFNILGGFSRLVRAHAPLHLGHPQRLVAAGQRPASAAATSTTSSPGS